MHHPSTFAFPGRLSPPLGSYPEQYTGGLLKSVLKFTLGCVDLQIVGLVLNVLSRSCVTYLCLPI